MPLTGALFVTNPRRGRRRKAHARRNTGLRKNRMTRARSAAKKAWNRSHRVKKGAGAAAYKKRYADRKAYLGSWKHSAKRIAKRGARAQNRTAAVSNPRRRRYSRRHNPRLVKGSAEAKARMAAIRGLRKGGSRRRKGTKRRSIRRTRRAATPAQLAALARGRAARRSKRVAAAYRSSLPVMHLNPRRRKARRNSGYRRNSGTLAIPGMSTVSGLLNRVPFGIGPAIAAALPVAVLAIGGTYLNAKFVSPYVSRYIPAQAAAFSGTLTGGAVAAAAYAISKFAPGMIGTVARTIAAASALAGVLSDAARFAQSKGLISGLSGIASMNGIAQMNGLALSGYGDGGAYDLSGVASMAGSHYHDAANADAAYSGPDLDSIEGSAALNGEGAWFGTFGVPAVRAVRRQGGPASRHAGRPGHKWAWLIRLVGFNNFQKIVALPPQERVAVIMGLRKQALESLPVLLSESQVAIPSAITATAYMQNDSTTAGLGGYGALMFAGHA